MPSRCSKLADQLQAWLGSSWKASSLVPPALGARRATRWGGCGFATEQKAQQGTGSPFLSQASGLGLLS